MLRTPVVRMVVSIVVLVAATSTLAACGAADERPRRVRVARAPSRPADRCAGAADAPNDAKDRMTAMQADLRRCWTLGTGKGDSEVQVQVTVAETGRVRAVKVDADASDPSAVDCMVRSLKGARFARFCGPDVAIRWTYALR